MKVMLAAMLGLMTAVVPVAAGEAAARVTQRDWTQTVTRTPAGAFVIGNPRARVKLVEYLSLTCDHCAHFSEEAWGPLRAGYIGKGLVSLEVRHAIRDPFDLTASLLARCAGPGGYFGATEAVLAKQHEWIGRASSFSDEGLEAKPINDRMLAMARGVGLDTLFEARGMPAPRVATCLSDPADQKVLAAMRDEAWNKREIGGTPAFLIDGELQQGVSSWDALEPRLKAALK